jgi:hypothetical protein
MATLKFKSGRGGRRKGGGRPKGSTISPHLKRVNLPDFRLPQWIVDWMKSQERSGGRIIEEALVKYYRLKPPAPKDKKTVTKPKRR